MKEYASILNEAFDAMPIDENALFVGCSYEDLQAEEMDEKTSALSSFFDYHFPEEFVVVVTGAYLVDPLDFEHELYDNCNNRYFLVRKSHFHKYLPEIIKKEEEIYKQYNLKLPLHKKEWLKTIKI